MLKILSIPEIDFELAFDNRHDSIRVKYPIGSSACPLDAALPGSGVEIKLPPGLVVRRLERADLTDGMKRVYASIPEIGLAVGQSEHGELCVKLPPGSEEQLQKLSRKLEGRGGIAPRRGIKLKLPPGTVAEHSSTALH